MAKTTHVFYDGKEVFYGTDREVEEWLAREHERAMNPRRCRKQHYADVEYVVTSQEQGVRGSFRHFREDGRQFRVRMQLRRVSHALNNLALLDLRYAEDAERYYGESCLHREIDDRQEVGA